jgi:hypothetical protein
MLMAAAHNLRTLMRIRASEKSGFIFVVWIFSTNSFTPENIYKKGPLSSTLTIGTSMGTPVGTHEIAILAVAENVGEPQSAIYTLTVEAESDFSVNVSPSREVVSRGSVAA